MSTVFPTFSIEGPSERRLLARLDQFDIALRQRLEVTIEGLTTRLLEAVQQAEPKRTGRLQRETQMFMDFGETFVRGRVRVIAEDGTGHNVRAAALEYGAHRIVQVRAHRRRPRARVNPYARHVNIAARRFLRAPLRGIGATAKAEIEQAIIAASHGDVT